MKRPTKVNILGKPYTIIYCKDKKEVNNEGDDVAWGFANPRNSTIRIYDGDFSDNDQLHLILHECIEVLS